MGPPKALDWPNPMSSISTMRTLGALAGALTSNRGGGVVFRTSSMVLCGYWGSGIGSTVRSLGTTTWAGAAPWAATGAAVSEARIRVRLKAQVIDVHLIGPPLSAGSRRAVSRRKSAVGHPIGKDLVGDRSLAQGTCSLLSGARPMGPWPHQPLITSRCFWRRSRLGARAQARELNART